MKPKQPKEKFFISSQVYDQFRPLTFTEKWNGMKGENTSAEGFQYWERIKEAPKRNFLLNSTRNERPQIQPTPRSNQQIL